jgi:hypothetical protein
MIQDYLKAGYPAILLLTQEPRRAESVVPCDGWTFLAWDCLSRTNHRRRTVANHEAIPSILFTSAVRNFLFDIRYSVFRCSIFDIPSLQLRNKP